MLEDSGHRGPFEGLEEGGSLLCEPGGGRPRRPSAVGNGRRRAARSVPAGGDDGSASRGGSVARGERRAAGGFGTGGRGRRTSGDSVIDRRGRRQPGGAKGRTSARRGRITALLVLVVAAALILVVGLAVGAGGREASPTGPTIPVSLVPLTTVLPPEAGASAGTPIIQAVTTDTTAP